MDRNDDGIRTDGHPENTGRELHMQPGRLEDIENATAYANRTGQRDVTGEMPGRMGEGERLHDREDMSGREGMAGEAAGNPMERGERQAQTGGGAHRVTPGEDIGNGIEAKPADGLEGADGRVQHGEDIGNGIRARRADEQSTNNPLV
ncbi:hypothetical protein [Longimicrobium sp.]|uniref:hypothetical protein n=1 Tax=Longimicrobium sp. TaxID=2029185 RepID=UPI002E36AE2E|nr:hypothetical protein [Longimicrobium sp.]HEX6042020.1 hypothetical protein [Longimicrobium sp.]